VLHFPRTGVRKVSCRLSNLEGHSRLLVLVPFGRPQWRRWPSELYYASPYITLTILVIKQQKLGNTNWLRFLFFVKAAAFY